MENLSIKERIFNAKVAATLGLAALTGLTAACSSVEPSPDIPVTVTEHEYDDPDTWVSVIVVGNRPLPITQYDPEHYYLHVMQCNREEEPDADDNGCLVFTEEVDPEFYAEIEDGTTLHYRTNPDNGRLVLSR